MLINTGSFWTLKCQFTFFFCFFVSIFVQIFHSSVAIFHLFLYCSYYSFYLLLYITHFIYMKHRREKKTFQETTYSMHWQCLKNANTKQHTHTHYVSLTDFCKRLLNNSFTKLRKTLNETNSQTNLVLFFCAEF